MNYNEMSTTQKVVLTMGSVYKALLTQHIYIQEVNEGGIVRE